MKIKKKLWAILLSAAMILTFLPAAAFAEDSAPAGDQKLAAAEAEAVPVKAEWSSMYDLRGVIGSRELLNLEVPDLASFIVTYDDDSTRKFVYTEFEDKDEQGNSYKYGLFYDENKDKDADDAYVFPMLDSEEGQKPFVNGKNPATITVYVPRAGEGGVIDSYAVTAEVEVTCEVDAYPLSAEFAPAGGFTPTCFIGYNYLTEENFYGKDNAFVVKYNGYDESLGDYADFTRTYSYAKGKTSDGDEAEGFFYKGDVNDQRFEFTEGKDVNLAKGTHEVEFTYEEYVPDLDVLVSIPVKTKITADKYNAYANYPVSEYTGKVITPKFTVYDSEDNVIPAAQYTVSKATAKSMGWHDVTITFKDKSKYISSITASYCIGPKKAKISKITAGKKKLTVKWKKFSKSQLKKIDGMYIEVATDKNFFNNYKMIKVSKKSLKSGKKTIKGLKKGKKYYVRAFTYKNVTQNGIKTEISSDYSKVKTKKTK